MKKVFITCFIFIALHTYGSYLKFSPVSGDFYFATDNLSFSSENSTLFLDYGILKAGSIAENSALGVLLDPFALKWNGLGRSIKAQGKVVYLNDGTFSFSLLFNPAFTHGIAYRKRNFCFSFAYTGEGVQDKEIIMLHEERGGSEAFHLLLSYEPAFLLLRVKVSYSERIGFKGMFSLGLSFSGISFAFSDGGVENFSGTPSEVRRFDAAIKGEYIDYKVSLSYGSAPLEAGSYRSYEAGEKLKLRFGEFKIECEHKFFFSMNGYSKGRSEYVISYKSLSLGFDNTFAPIFRYDNGIWCFSFEDGDFSFALSLKGERLTLVLGLDSKGEVISEVKLLF